MSSAGRFDLKCGVKDRAPKKGPFSLTKLKQAVREAATRMEQREAKQASRVVVTRIVKGDEA